MTRYFLERTPGGRLAVVRLVDTWRGRWLRRFALVERPDGKRVVRPMRGLRRSA